MGFAIFFRRRQTASLPVLLRSPGTSTTTFCLSGACADKSWAMGQYDLEGYTASGAPYYKKAGASTMHIYWDPDCDGGDGGDGGGGSLPFFLKILSQPEPYTWE